MDMKSLKEDLNVVLKKYGYNINTLCIDERHGRNSHLESTIELTLEEIKEEPRSFWID